MVIDDGRRRVADGVHDRSTSPQDVQARQLELITRIITFSNDQIPCSFCKTVSMVIIDGVKHVLEPFFADRVIHELVGFTVAHDALLLSHG